MKKKREAVHCTGGAACEFENWFEKRKNNKTQQSKKKKEKRKKGWRYLEREHAHLRGGSVV